MNIFLASDHAGFELKNFIFQELKNRGFNVFDNGAFSLIENDNYTDFIPLAVKKVTEDFQNNVAIIFGGSGQGEAICANRFNGIRCTTYYHYDLEIIKLSKEHNNANVLSIGARFVNNEQALESILLWLETKYEGGRHEVRNRALDNLC